MTDELPHDPEHTTPEININLDTEPTPRKQTPPLEELQGITQDAKEAHQTKVEQEASEFIEAGQSYIDSSADALFDAIMSVIADNLVAAAERGQDSMGVHQGKFTPEDIPHPLIYLQAYERVATELTALNFTPEITDTGEGSSKRVISLYAHWKVEEPQPEPKEGYPEVQPKDPAYSEPIQ